ncbi:hypothetical protein ZHAS_00015114 [Anopheles sinensis]|uniref:Uncharacterized protein n=1 Tax=Anopheles sinensis TaxID=74873 RepID=A0A084WA27_ANOSI|nr:hypothetical protein ZHAS_00015114 [Anopheles sinensis]
MIDFASYDATNDGTRQPADRYGMLPLPLDLTGPWRIYAEANGHAKATARVSTGFAHSQEWRKRNNNNDVAIRHNGQRCMDALFVLHSSQPLHRAISVPGFFSNAN